MPKQNIDQNLKNILDEDTEEALSINLHYTLADGTLPIHYACLYNSLNFFTRLDLIPSQLNYPGGFYGSTPLMFTMYNSSYKAALFLLLNGADVLTRNNKNSDVLSVCARFDNLFGMILVLSFVEYPTKVDRYLKYAEMKKSFSVWKFLNLNKGEIENLKMRENESKKESKKGIFKKLKKFLQVIFILFLALYVPAFRIFISGCFALTYFVFLNSEIPLFFNLLYSIYAYYVLLSEDLNFSIIVFMHSMSFLVLLCIRNKHKGINRMSEIKEIVTHLVLEDQFTRKYFCYTCLNTKEEKVKHCRICDRCILNQNHHCPFMNKCISRGMIPFFFAFVLFSVVLFISAVVNSPSKVCKFEFFVCFLVAFISLVFMLVKVFSCHRKVK